MPIWYEVEHSKTGIYNFMERVPMDNYLMIDKLKKQEFLLPTDSQARS